MICNLLNSQSLVTRWDLLWFDPICDSVYIVRTTVFYSWRKCELDGIYCFVVLFSEFEGINIQSLICFTQAENMHLKPSTHQEPV